MKKITAILVFGALTGFSIPAGKYHKMDTFAWLRGAWAMHMDRGTITESWKAVDDSTYTGESKMIKANGEVKPFEDIKLVYRNNEYYYIPVTAGQNDEKPVPFRLTSYSQTGFVAENPDHDFPKRITYILLNKDSIHAYIDGGPANPGKKMDFFYAREK